MTRVILCIGIFFSISFFAHGQMDSLLIESFQTAVDEYLSSSNAIGISTAVIAGEENWRYASGKNSSTSDLDINSEFAIGSVSKTITSAVVLQMKEEEKLELDDKINMYIQDFENVHPDVTIKNLLNHTSGIYNYTNHPNFINDVIDKAEEILEEEYIMENFVLPPNFMPGVSWEYSNSNYILLGMIIESIAGQPSYLEARERFSFDLNYPSIKMPPFESDLSDIAHLWLDVTGLGLPQIDMQEDGFSLNALFSAAGAAGAYVGTPIDIAHWAEDLYSGSLLQESTMTELLAVEWPSQNYGLGVAIVPLQCGQTVQGHSGNIIYSSITMYDQENEVAISIHCNDGDNPGVVGPLGFELMCIYDEYLQTVSTIDTKEANDVRIYPNPSITDWTLEYEVTQVANVDISIINEMGKVLENIRFRAQSPGLHQIKLDNSYPDGFYFVHITIGDQQINRKLILNNK